MLRWISNSRVSLQRLGFCKLALALCKGCRSRSELADAVWPVIQTPVTAQASPELAKWVHSHPKRVKHSTGASQMGIHKQDFWIFEHPSQTGWLSRGAFAEYFEDIGLPFLLGLLDDECRRSDIGELLMMLQDTNDKSVLWEPPQNPIVLTRGEQVLFVFSLLKNDGDFLIPFMHALIKYFGEKTFSYLDAGNLIPDVIEEILQRFTGAVFTSSDREEYLKLKAAKSEITKNIEKKAETKGFGSRREQTAVPRLEWLVDLGILSRAEDQRYRYSSFPRSREFIECAYSSYLDASDKGYVDEAVDKVLDNQFIQLVQHLLYGRTGAMTQIHDIIEFLLPAYVEFSSITGYCLIRSLLLLSHVRKWDSGEACVLEYNQAVQTIEKAYQQDPERFYFTTARFGEDFQIKLDKLG
ncbi:MAG: hypothetical protein ACFFCW_02145 [Candidatus Hodarchaeota archaeon]